MTLLSQTKDTHYGLYVLYLSAYIYLSHHLQCDDSRLFNEETVVEINRASGVPPLQPEVSKACNQSVTVLAPFPRMRCTENVYITIDIQMKCFGDCLPTTTSQLAPDQAQSLKTSFPTLFSSHCLKSITSSCHIVCTIPSYVLNVSPMSVSGTPICVLRNSVLTCAMV